MRVLHQLVFDGFVSGAQLAFLPPEIVTPAGQVDSLTVSGYSYNVSGTSPTLSVIIEESPDLLSWIGGAFISGLALSTTQETLFQAIDPSQGRSRFARVRITLGGTNPQGYFRIWLTGRDQSLKA